MIEIISAIHLPALADARLLIGTHLAVASQEHDAASTARLVDALPAPYEPPAGGLWVARREGESVGCVALRALSPTTGEVKRMYVQPAHRGHGVARALLAHLIDEAQARHYHTLRLGTLTAMRAAQSLYERFGFRQITPYRGAEFGDALFYERTLDTPAD